MDIKRQREALERLGLTAHQTEVYLVLLQRGPLGAAALAAAADIPRTRAYEVTKALQDQGLVTTTLDAPTRFRALPIRHYVEQARERLRTEEASLEQRLPGLEEMLPIKEHEDGHGTETSSGFTPLRGARIVKSKLIAVLGSARDAVWVSVDARLVERLKVFMDEVVTAGVDLRILHHAQRETLLPALRLAASGANVRHAPAPEHLAVFLVDGQECVMTFPSKTRSKDPAAGLWTDEPSFVEAQVDAFERTWAHALRMEDRQRELEQGEVPRTTDLLRAGPDEDPATGTRIFLDAAEHAFAAADRSLDLAFPAPALSSIRWDALCKRLEMVRARIMLPIPSSAEEETIIARLLAIADVRELPSRFAHQAFVIRDHTECLAATLSSPGPDAAPAQWESVIVSDEQGLVTAVAAHFDASWAGALNLEEASPAGMRPSGNWWSTSRRSGDAIGWAREAMATAVRSIEIRATETAALLVPALLRSAPPQVPVTRSTENDGFMALALIVDDALCLVIEEPEVREVPGGEMELIRVGHVTFTNSTPMIEVWKQSGRSTGTTEERGTATRTELSSR